MAIDIEGKMARMFRGFGFAIPAILATGCTTLAGGFFGAFAWVVAFFDGSHVKSRLRFPVALYVYTVSVCIVIAGGLAVEMLPDSWEQYRILGERVRPALDSVFLAMSFLGMIASAALMRKPTGPTRGPLLIGTFVVLSGDLLALAVFLLILNGMTFH